MDLSGLASFRSANQKQEKDGAKKILSNHRILGFCQLHRMHPVFARVKTLIKMANSIELENVGGERYMVKDVKAKIQVDRISKELKVIIDFFEKIIHYWKNR